MADYWITNPRHYCEVCKCWLGNNKISIENHEKGPRHRGNIEKQLRETRKRAAQKEREEEKVTETLAQIEKAANAAYKRDQKGLPPRESSVVKKALAEEKKNKGKKPSVSVPAVPPPPPSPWQQLLSPEGCVYYYHVLTGVSQWECPPELRKPSNKPTTPVPKGSSTFGTFTRNSKGSIVPTASKEGCVVDPYDGENSIQAEWIKRSQERDEFLQRPFTELAATVKYYTEEEEGEGEKGEGESSEDSRPPLPKRFDPYGAWQTITIRTQETPKQEEVEEEEEDEEDTNIGHNSSDEECTFKEKTLPSTGLERGGGGVKEEVTTGSFKSFSFKKSTSGSRNIKKRTSQW